MDLETGLRMISGTPQLHGFTTTFLGSFIVGTVSGAIGKPITDAFLRVITRERRLITWRAAFIASYAGAFSHVILDSIMHSDAQPWAPFSTQNEFLGFVPLDVLHLTCIALGFLGCIALYIRSKSRTEQNGSANPDSTLHRRDR